MAVNGSQAKDAKLMAGLLTGMSVADAALSAGYSERTAHRRLHDPEFRAMLATSAAAVRSAAEVQLIASAGEAVQTLRSIMSSDAPPTARVAAAKAVLQLAAAARFGDLTSAEIGLEDVRAGTLGRYLAANPSRVGPIVTALAAIRDAELNDGGNTAPSD